MSSSERSKLQSALQQAQKKVQEQSEQIVKLSEADLILKDNEKLKEENGKLRKEKEESESKAARVEEVCEARLKRKDQEVQKKIKEAEDAKAKAQKKEKKAEELIRDQERLIRKEVEDREEKIWDIYILKKQRALADAEEKWKAGKKNLIWWGAFVSLYALAVTILLGHMSEAYRTALKAAGRQTGGIALAGCKKLLDLAEKAAGISAGIPVPVLKDIVCWIILIVIVGIYILAVRGILILLIRKIKSIFILETAWPVFLALGGIVTITAVFGNELQKICPVSIVYAGLLIWLIFSIFWVLFTKKG